MSDCSGCLWAQRRQTTTDLRRHSRYAVSLFVQQCKVAQHVRGAGFVDLWCVCVRMCVRVRVCDFLFTSWVSVAVKCDQDLQEKTRDELTEREKSTCGWSSKCSRMVSITTTCEGIRSKQTVNQDANRLDQATQSRTETATHTDRQAQRRKNRKQEISRDFQT